MSTRRFIFVIAALLLAVAARGRVVTGDERVELWKPLLQGQRVALLGNHTSLAGEVHFLDLMLQQGIDVTVIFSPEHGFRGSADAGEHVASSVDAANGIPIASLYDGRRPYPATADMQRFDVLAIDLQDVGTRFYTYYITMLNMMRACADEHKPVVLLDRPNPNGMYVDGPILDMSLKSGVGALPIPIVHGMTLGELAQMICGEGWLENQRQLDLTVVPCSGYDHSTRYALPVPPSPNLPTMKAVYLYPSMCYFEGTVASLGRGTDRPFCIYGHPAIDGDYSFTPRSLPGAKKPPLLGRLCHGRDLSATPDASIIDNRINLQYIIDAYRAYHGSEPFFTKFFDLLIGRADVRPMIEAGKSAAEIKATWAADVKRFRSLRAKYLLYLDAFSLP